MQELALALVELVSANVTDTNTTNTNTTNTNSTSSSDGLPPVCQIPELPVNIPFVDSVSGLWVVWSVALFFVLLSWVISFYLIYKHLKFYTQPEHQRYIVRLICMVPLYGLYSLLSLIFHQHQTYFAIARDCYEAYALFMFFKLCVSYGGGKDAIIEHFLSLPKLKLTFPLNCWSVQPNELFFTVCKQGMLQYVLVRPIVSIWAAILQMFGAYGDGSFSFFLGYSYASFINNVCVCIALYIVVLFEQAAKELLHPYRPILKFLSVKMVIFLAFWQSIVIAIMADFNWIPKVPCLSPGDVSTGLQNFLMCFEMFLIALLHIVAYPYELYRVRALTNAPINSTVKSSVLKNMVNMMNQADLVKDTLESLSIHRHAGKHDAQGAPAHASPLPHPFASQPVNLAPLAVPAQRRTQYPRYNVPPPPEDDEVGLLVNASMEPTSEPAHFLAPSSPHLFVHPAPDADFNPRQRPVNAHTDPLIEMDELATDDDLLDDLDDEDLDYEHLRR